MSAGAPTCRCPKFVPDQKVERRARFVQNVAKDFRKEAPIDAAKVFGLIAICVSTLLLVYVLVMYLHSRQNRSNLQNYEVGGREAGLSNAVSKGTAWRSVGMSKEGVLEEALSLMLSLERLSMLGHSFMGIVSSSSLGLA